MRREKVNSMSQDQTGPSCITTNQILSFPFSLRYMDENVSFGFVSPGFQIPSSEISTFTPRFVFTALKMQPSNVSSPRYCMAVRNLLLSPPIKGLVHPQFMKNWTSSLFVESLHADSYGFMYPGFEICVLEISTSTQIQWRWMRCVYITEKPLVLDAGSSVSLRCGGQGGGSCEAGNQSSSTFMSLY